MHDLHNRIHPVPAIPCTRSTDNVPLVSAIIDTLGFGSLTFILLTGTLADADATFAVLLQDGDAADLSDAATVPDAELIGTAALAGFTAADDAKTRKVGYAGFKRYVRLTVTPAGNSGNADIGAVAVLAHPYSIPTANPPA